jgi:hypothetical protein
MHDEKFTQIFAENSADAFNAANLFLYFLPNPLAVERQLFDPGRTFYRADPLVSAAPDFSELS